jgi:hypothetical protein
MTLQSPDVILSALPGLQGDGAVIRWCAITRRRRKGARWTIRSSGSQVSQAVRANSAISTAAGGVETYEAMGWTNELRVRPTP